MTALNVHQLAQDLNPYLNSITIVPNYRDAWPHLRENIIWLLNRAGPGHTFIAEDVYYKVRNKEAFICLVKDRGYDEGVICYTFIDEHSEDLNLWVWLSWSRISNNDFFSNVKDDLNTVCKALGCRRAAWATTRKGYIRAARRRIPTADPAMVTFFHDVYT